MPVKKLFPSYQKFINGFLRAKECNRLQHAYAVVGRRGSGKGELIKTLASSLLETSAIQHPDIIEIHGGHPDTSLDAIRQFLASFQESPIGGQLRIGIIYSLDALATSSQNALLKTLEEPPKNHVILSTLADASSLLPTILSRVIVLRIPRIPLNELTKNQRLSKENLQMLASIYSGEAKAFSHLSEDAIHTFEENHELVIKLLGEHPWEAIENAFKNNEDLPQLQNQLRLWIAFLRNILIVEQTLNKRQHLLQVISACSSALYANSLSSARLTIEKSLV